MGYKKSTLFMGLMIISLLGYTQSKTVLTVQVDKPGAPVQPTMWGIFFEDINSAADGGLYAELVKNRSFEFDDPMMGWREEKNDRFAVTQKAGAVMIVNRGESSGSNSRMARVTILDDKAYELTNEGFHGIGVKKDDRYEFSVWARPQQGNIALRVEVIDEQQKILGTTSIQPDNKEWKKYTATFVASETYARSKLRLTFSGKGVIDLDMISLFPANTWKSRPGGLRADLVQLLYDLKPGFLRFPGGCIVEGRDLAKRYQWKKTIGAVEDRKLLINRWNTEFRHRLSPDYYQSFGLGFYEYFLLAEDLGASPLPILSCGIACQFNTGEVVPMNQLAPYIQDALDLIEFANGPVTSTWGKLRAAMGHPAPFAMKMIGVGNEQWGPQYIERYKAFAEAIKAAHPEITIVSGSGPFAEGELFEYGWKELKDLNAEIVDEHYYKKSDWFLQNADRYDHYDRNGPKVFAGEYAVQSVAIASPDNKNNWQGALAEAAFMTGLERNADVVYLSSYAPLFAHVDRWQWTPDLIWFDNLTAYGTPDYYVQKMFSTHRGTHVLSIREGKDPVTGKNELYASAVWDDTSKEIILKVVNASAQKQYPEIQLIGARKIDPNASLTVLSGALAGVNSIENPEAIKPVEGTVNLKGKTWKAELPSYSFSVLRIKTR